MAVITEKLEKFRKNIKAMHYANFLANKDV
jgi:hypothetical protein